MKYQIKFFTKIGHVFYHHERNIEGEEAAQNLAKELAGHEYHYKIDEEDEE